MARKFQVLDWPAARAALGGRTDPETVGNIRAAINEFLAKPPERMSRFQNAASAQDFPDSVLPQVSKFQELSFYDDGWESAFDVMDFSASKRNGFEILTVEDGLTFESVPEGQKAKVYAMSGDKVTVHFEKIGGALGWSRTLLDDEEYWAIDNAVAAFRNKWYATRAETAYALIEALGSAYNVTWQTAVPTSLASTDANYTAIRDINTINKAGYDILNAVKDSGYGITPSTPVVLLYPLALAARIRRALTVQNWGLSGEFPGVQYNVIPIPTLSFASATSYYVVLPKNKLVWGDRMSLSVFDEFDPASYSDVQYGWGRYGGAIGDSNQLRRCAIS